MNKKLFVKFIISLSLVGFYITLQQSNKDIVYKVPNGTYNIKRISCSEDLHLDNKLIDRETLGDYEMLFSFSLDFDDIIQRQLVVKEDEGNIILSSKDCSSTARFKIDNNTNHIFSLNFRETKIHQSGNCKFKKTYDNKVFYINKPGHFAIDQLFLNSYWIDIDTPITNWTPRVIDNKFVIELNLDEAETEIPCRDKYKVLWVLEKV
jgi:hypothetical protein